MNTAPIPLMYYFGPWDSAGHSLHLESGAHPRPIADSFPWSPAGYDIDGKLQPSADAPDHRINRASGVLSTVGHAQTEGEALLHYRDGWTALAFWDRSVDARASSNSTYFAEGVYSFEQMVELASTRFAKRWDRHKDRFQVKLLPALSAI